MKPVILAAKHGKRLFTSLRLDRLVEPVNPLLLRVGYLAKQARWVREHPAPFTDAADPAFRHGKRYDLYRHVLRAEGLDGPIRYLEFGVAGGESFRWWTDHNRHPGSTFVGFDTFTGLPEDWAVYRAGTFDQQGAPPETDDPRVRYEAGLFQDTLPGFLEHAPLGGRKVVHLDADLYSSTLYVLTRLAPVLGPGDVLLFDEFGVPTHEFRAFTDFVSAYRVGYEVLGAVNNYLQVALKLT